MKKCIRKIKWELVNFSQYDGCPEDEGVHSRKLVFLNYLVSTLRKRNISIDYAIGKAFRNTFRKGYRIEFPKETSKTEALYVVNIFYAAEQFLPSYSPSMLRDMMWSELDKIKNIYNSFVKNGDNLKAISAELDEALSGILFCFDKMLIEIHKEILSCSHDAGYGKIHLEYSRWIDHEGLCNCLVARFSPSKIARTFTRFHRYE